MFGRFAAGVSSDRQPAGMRDARRRPHSAMAFGMRSIRDRLICDLHRFPHGQVTFGSIGLAPDPGRLETRGLRGRLRRHGLAGELPRSGRAVRRPSRALGRRGCASRTGRRRGGTARPSPGRRRPSSRPSPSFGASTSSRSSASPDRTIELPVAHADRPAAGGGVRAGSPRAATACPRRWRARRRGRRAAASARAMPPASFSSVGYQSTMCSGALTTRAGLDVPLPGREGRHAHARLRRASPSPPGAGRCS